MSIISNRGGYERALSIIKFPMAFAVVVLHLGLSEQHIAYESLNMNVLLDKTLIIFI